MQQNNSKQKIMAGSITALVVIVLIGAISFYETNHGAASATSTTSAPSSSSSSTTTPASSSNISSSSSASTTSYKDGTYSATSNYYVPHGVESIKVTLTLKSGVVTDSTIANSESDRESQRYQQGFAQSYKSYVVGKNISDVKLSYVAGASDTTSGFNDAVDSIITQSQQS